MAQDALFLSVGMHFIVDCHYTLPDGQSWQDGLVWGHWNSRFQYLEVSRVLSEDQQEGEAEGEDDRDISHR